MNHDRQTLKKTLCFAGAVILCAASALAIIKTILLSIDIDESYAITLGYRLAQGDRLFCDMWEIHQTSALLYAPLIWLFYHVTGTMDGIVIFLRTVGALLHLCLSLWVYRSVKRAFPGKAIAFLCAAAFVNFLPKYIQSPEYSLLYFWATVCTVLCIVEFLYRPERHFYLFASGVFLAVACLSYPSMILLYPFYLFAFFRLFPKTKQKGKLYASAVFTSGVVTVFFLVFIILCLKCGLPTFINNLPYIFMDGSHGAGLVQKLTQYGKECWHLCKSFLIAAVFGEFIHYLYHSATGKTNRFPQFFLLGYTLWESCMWMRRLWSSSNYIVMKVIFWFFLIGLYFYLKSNRSRKSQVLFYLAWLPSLAALCSALLVTNLSVERSSFTLFPGAVASLLFLQDPKDCPTVSLRQNKAFKTIGAVVLAFFCLVLLSSKLCLVVVTGTKNEPVTVHRVQLQEGPAMGLWLNDRDAEDYRLKYAAVKRCVTKDDRILYVGRDVLMYPAMGCRIATCNCISTPIFDRQLLDYYEKYPEKKPTKILLDLAFLEERNLFPETNEVAEWIIANYDIAHADKSERLWIVSPCPPPS